MAAFQSTSVTATPRAPCDGAPSLTAATVLADHRPGEFRLATSANVDDTLSRLTNLAPNELNGGRIILLAWSELPSLSLIVEETIDQLAQAALALWPQWYVTDPSYEGGQSTLMTLIERTQQAGMERLVLPHWLELADIACQTKRTPRWANEFTAEVEARQMALALGDQSCRLILLVGEPEQGDAALLGLARALEWLAHETRLPTLVVVPSELGKRCALDGINFGMVELAGEVMAEVTPTQHEAVTLAQPAKFETPSRQPVRRRSRLIVRPLIGRPHPDSAGEQILWEKLQADPELAGLFLCNQWTTTICDTTYLVDFVWVIGKLVVEVDGYYWHSSQYSFAFDRRRDYEFHLTGHVVLRLPHDEVIADADGAIERIRRLVRMRQQA